MNFTWREIRLLEIELACNPEAEIFTACFNPDSAVEMRIGTAAAKSKFDAIRSRLFQGHDQIENALFAVGKQHESVIGAE
jgi:hypothetical protein